MVNVDNDPARQRRQLPSEGPAATGPGFGIPLARILELDAFNGADVHVNDAAGGDALVRMITVRTDGVLDLDPVATVAASRRRGSPTVHELAAAALTVMVEHQRRVLLREDEIHRAIVRLVPIGASLDDVCANVVTFLGGVALVTSTDGRVLAQGGTLEDISAARALPCFDRSGRFIVEEEPVGVRRDRGAVDRAMVRIVSGNADHGRLLAFTPGSPLTPDDVHLLERTANVAALTITREEAVSAMASKYRAEFLRDALVGRAGSHEEALGHASSLGWTLRTPMVVVVAETDEDDTDTTRPPEEVRALQERFARAWIRAVTVRDPQTPVVGLRAEVVTILGVADDAGTETIMRSIGDLVRVVRGDGGGGRRTFATGVSRPALSVSDLPRAYDEARKAVSVGRQMHGNSAVTHFDGLGIFRLLAQVADSADLRRFVGEALGELATDDHTENADLRHTLEVLIDTNLNVAESARRLFFHYNTLRYRIAKLERMVGPFTTDAELRLTLALALKVIQMRGIPGA